MLGLIFSILGLVRSGKVGGKGRGLAISGLVLSVLAFGGWTALIVEAGNSPAADPGCRTAESAFSSMISKLEADESKLTADSNDATAMQGDLATFTADIQSIKSVLDNSLAQAEHQSVKDKLQAMDTDVSTVLSGLQAIQSGDVGQLDQFEAAAGRLGPDGDALDSLCSTL